MTQRKHGGAGLGARRKFPLELDVARPGWLQRPQGPSPGATGQQRGSRAWPAFCCYLQCRVVATLPEGTVWCSGVDAVSWVACLLGQWL